MGPASAWASEIATCATGVPVRAARTAEAYSVGSRSTRSGTQASHASSIPASIASVASRPNSSRLPSTDASAAGTTGRRSLIAATCSSGGSPPRPEWEARRPSRATRRPHREDLVSPTTYRAQKRHQRVEVPSAAQGARGEDPHRR